MNFTQNKSADALLQSDEIDKHEERVINCIFVVSGILAIVTNLFYLILLYKDKKLKSKKKYMAAYAVGSALLGIAYLMIHGLQLGPNFQWPLNMTPLMCMLHLPNITFFKLGDMIVVLSILYMSIDAFSAIVPGVNMRKKEKALNAMNWIALAGLLFDLAFAWISAALNNAILPICYHKAIVGEYSFLFHYWSMVVFGYLSMFLYVTAVVMLKRQKSSSSGIREIQMKREYEVMKQVVLIMLNSFLLETIPITVSLCSTFLASHIHLANYIWLLQAANLSLFAIIRILKHPSCLKSFKKVYVSLSGSRSQRVGTVQIVEKSSKS